MTRRWTLLAGALALSLGAPQAAFATPAAVASASAADPDPGVTALRDLEADADGPVRVTRDESGDVAHVSSTDGSAMLDSDAATPSGAAREQLADHGDAFGIDGETSTAVVTGTLDSAAGGSVVRAEQVVDGVPVFGGQVVLSLDDHQDVVSVASATTDATEVAAARVSEAQARRTALAAVAKAQHVDPGVLTVAPVGRRLYDPVLVHVSDPAGARPVWQLTVSNGSDIRETVLVGTDRGEVALHFNDAPEAVDRRICDNADNKAIASTSQVPVCSTPARVEGGPASPTSEDVNEAYDNLGAVSDAYSQLDGIDLTALIGVDVGGTRSLQATVRWCYTDETCPYANAFWDGTQMVFGADYAGADDVVGHELTHGYVEHTSALFNLHQSGAINESVADTIGEIIDHRNPKSPTSDAAWDLGEDTPAGAVRSLKDPTLHGQPDKMTSPFFVTADVFDDNGAVHDNNGVGNKTAYLISQGGTFNGRTVTGIDTGDPSLARTGRLYLETIKRLTSGAEYADLGVVLGSTCDQLVATHTGGFTAANCTSVRSAVAATELAKQPADPAAAAAEASSACAPGFTREVIYSDDDATQDLDWQLGGLWQRTPDNGTPSYSYEGSSSLFAWDPDPEVDGTDTSDATSRPFTVSELTPTYFTFHHAYLLEYYPADSTGPATYYDGAQVIVQAWDDAAGTWVDRPNLPWVNGPDHHVESLDGGLGFAGDSMGYGSSRLDLSSLAGQQVHIVLRVTGDETDSYSGWWVDDAQLYDCYPLPPTAPTRLTSVGGVGSAVVSWSPPTMAGAGGVQSYEVRIDNGTTRTLPGTARKVTVSLPHDLSATVTVDALSAYGYSGPSTTIRITPVNAFAGVSVRRVKKNRPFTVTAHVFNPQTGARTRGARVVLQRRVLPSTKWVNVTSGLTGPAGAKAWRVRLQKTTYYRVHVLGGTNRRAYVTGALRVLKK